jgi:TM2 domain-containing membrane protein YozV
MDRLISPINLEGLSESGRLQLREETYQQHKKSGVVATLLLLAGGTIAAHRFYLGFHKIAWAIIAVNVFVLSIAIMMNSILLFQI